MWTAPAHFLFFFSFFFVFRFPFFSIKIVRPVRRSASTRSNDLGTRCTTRFDHREIDEEKTIAFPSDEEGHRGTRAKKEKEEKRSLSTSLALREWVMRGQGGMRPRGNDRHNANSRLTRNKRSTLRVNASSTKHR